MSDVVNDLNEIEKIIEEGNKEFVKIVRIGREDEKSMLEFFREKFNQFILYKLFRKNGWNVSFEEKTESKFSKTGRIFRSGNHDLVILDDKFRPIAGLEIFLGYDAGKQHQLNYESFKEHLYSDYQKLVISSLQAAYIVNYFYKGSSQRSPLGYTTKKETSYLTHLTNCVIECEELVKKHKNSNSEIKLVIWIVEARDDGLHSMGIKRIS